MGIRYYTRGAGIFAIICGNESIEQRLVETLKQNPGCTNFRENIAMKNKAFLAYGMMLAVFSLLAAISFDAPGHVYVEGAKPIARGGVPGGDLRAHRLARASC